MLKRCFYLLLLLHLVSCFGGRNKNNITNGTQTVVDTVDHLKRAIRMYGSDSIAWFYHKRDSSEAIVRLMKYKADSLTGKILYRYFDFNGNVVKEVFITENINGEIHYKTFYDTGELKQIAYVSDSLCCDTTEMNLAFLRTDFIEEYSKNGFLSKSGFVGFTSEMNYNNAEFYDIIGVWNTYDSSGRIVETITALDGYGGEMMYETFYPNGKLEMRNFQGIKFGAGLSLGYQKYDSLGNILIDVYNQHFLRDEAETNYDIYQVELSKEYYPNGKLKKLSRSKSFYESDVCPCGKWEYYNETGKIIKTEVFPDCYNYKLDCDEFMDVTNE